MFVSQEQILSYFDEEPASRRNELLTIGKAFGLFWNSLGRSILGFQN